MARQINENCMMHKPIIQVEKIEVILRKFTSILSSCEFTQVYAYLSTSFLRIHVFTHIEGAGRAQGEPWMLLKV